MAKNLNISLGHSLSTHTYATHIQKVMSVKMARTIGIMLLTVLCFAPFVHGQAVRYDTSLLTPGPGVPVSGGPLPQMLGIVNATVQVCQHPATLSSCIPATTYNDAAEDAICPPATPMVLLPGTQCTASTGPSAAIGFWFSNAIVDYIVTTVYDVYGPFSVTTVQGAGVGVTNNFTALQNFNAGLTATSIAAATVTSQTVNGVVNVASPLWGAGDIQTKLVAATAAAGNLDLYIPSSGGYPNCYSFANPIVFTGLKLTGAGEDYGTCLEYTGTGIAFTAGSWQNISNLAIVGTSNLGTGFLLQGAYTEINHVLIQGFNLGVTFGNNTYLDAFYHSNIQNNTKNLLWPGGLTNSGENIKFDHVVFANGLTYTNCAQFGVQGSYGPEVDLIADSFDGCQLVNNEGIMRGVGDHFEDVGSGPLSVPFFVGYDSDLNANTGQTYTRFADISVVNDHTDTANGAFEVDRFASLSIDGLADYATTAQLFYLNTGSSGAPILNFKAPNNTRASTAVYNIASSTSPLMNIETQVIHQHAVNGNEVWSQNVPASQNYLKSTAMAFNGSGVPILDLGKWSGVGTNYFSSALQLVGNGFNFCYNGGFALTDLTNFGNESLTCSSSLISGIFTGLGIKIGGGTTIANTNAIPQVGTPTVGQAACIKAAGPPVVIGYCSTVVSSSGACTCN